MSDSSPLVYLIIVNYNSSEHSIELLNSIKRLTYPHKKTIILDNCSTDNSLRKITSHLNNESVVKFDLSVNTFTAESITNTDFCLVKSDKNGGYACGNNLVLQSILKENAFVWLLNPDTTVENDSLSHLIETSSQNPSAIYTTSIKSEGSDDIRSGLCYINKWLGTTHHITEKKKRKFADYIYGASLFTHLQVFRTVGLFPEDYFLYWEETKWCMHASRLNIPFVWCKKALIYDKVSSLGNNKSYLSEYYFSLNALRFFSVYHPFYFPFVVFANAARIIYRFLQGNSLRSKAILKATAHYFSKKIIFRG
ncbi:MAG: glycosyltransferase family 2 protein [Cyclobacteriaceae bacterium]